MRFFSDHTSSIAFAEIEAALKADDSAYRIVELDRDAADLFDCADLYYGDDAYARIEINRPGERLFHAEIQEHVEAVDYDGEGQTARVIDTLRNANAIIRVHVLWGGRDSDLTLSRLQPLWQWLFLVRSGVLQADSEGYYDEDDIIVEAS